MTKRTRGCPVFAELFHSISSRYQDVLRTQEVCHIDLRPATQKLLRLCDVLHDRVAAAEKEFTKYHAWREYWAPIGRREGKRQTCSALWPSWATDEERAAVMDAFALGYQMMGVTRGRRIRPFMTAKIKAKLAKHAQQLSKQMDTELAAAQLFNNKPRSRLTVEDCVRLGRKALKTAMTNITNGKRCPFSNPLPVQWVFLLTDRARARYEDAIDPSAPSRRDNSLDMRNMESSLPDSVREAIVRLERGEFTN